MVICLSHGPAETKLFLGHVALLTVTEADVFIESLAFWVKFSADDILKYFFSFFPENKIVPFGDTLHEVSNLVFWELGDNLHELSNPVSWEK